MRPGRLDRIFYVGPPDRAGREEILTIRMRAMAVAPDVDVGAIADLVRTLFPVLAASIRSLAIYFPPLTLKNKTDGWLFRGGDHRALPGGRDRHYAGRHGRAIRASLPLLGPLYVRPDSYITGTPGGVRRRSADCQSPDNAGGAAEVRAVARWQFRAPALRPLSPNSIPPALFPPAISHYHASEDAAVLLVPWGCVSPCYKPDAVGSCTRWVWVPRCGLYLLIVIVNRRAVPRVFHKERVVA